MGLDLRKVGEVFVAQSRVGYAEDVVEIAGIAGDPAREVVFAEEALAAEDKSEAVGDPGVAIGADSFGEIEIEVGHIAGDAAHGEARLEQAGSEGRSGGGPQRAC